MFVLDKRHAGFDNKEQSFVLRKEPVVAQAPIPVVHTRWPRAIAVAVVAAVIVGVVVLAFIWPAVTSTIQRFPVAVVGASAQAEAFTDALATEVPDGFDTVVADTREEAVRLIEHREVYGAVVLGGPAQAPEVLTASANGIVTSQVMGQLAGQLQKQVSAAIAEAQAAATAQAAAAGVPASAVPEIPAATVVTTDVVPLASSDERGTGLTAAAFPLVLGGILGGILVSLLVAGVWRRFTAIALYAVFGASGIVAIMQGWFGILHGDALPNVAAVALALFATGAVIVGLTALIGPPGIAVGSIITMLVANPIASATQPLQFLPEPWGAVGQFFVPGASVTLLRDLSYFTEADASASWLVLGAWALVGVLLMALGHFRNAEVIHERAQVTDAAPSTRPVVAASA